jgi:glutamine synthetase
MILKTGLEDKKAKASDRPQRLRQLPGNINDAIRLYRGSDFVTKAMGEKSKDKYLGYKQASAYRNPRELGTSIKASEILYHHEITNQYLWNRF